MKSKSTRKNGQGGQERISFASAGVQIRPLSLTQNLLPRRMMKWFSYASCYSQNTGTSGATSSAAVTFSLNSAYDPEFSGTGRQPYGWDQITAFYNRYIVHDVRIKVTCTTIGATSEVVVCYFVQPSTSSSASLTSTAVEQVIEKPMVGSVIVSSSGNARNSQFQLHVRPWEVEGITREQYLESLSDYMATVSANPSKQPTFGTVTGSPSGASTVSVTFVVELDYLVELVQPNILASS